MSNVLVLQVVFAVIFIGVGITIGILASRELIRIGKNNGLDFADLEKKHAQENQEKLDAEAKSSR